MACCKCCCGNEDCSEGQQGKCCCGGAEGTCCSETQYCCDGECSDEPCDCTADEDCFFCDTGYSFVPGCSGLLNSSEYGSGLCCGSGSVAFVDDPGDPRYGNCVSSCEPGDAGNNYNIISDNDVANMGYCCDGVCQETECPPP